MEAAQARLPAYCGEHEKDIVYVDNLQFMSIYTEYLLRNTHNHLINKIPQLPLYGLHVLCWKSEDSLEELPVGRKWDLLCSISPFTLWTFQPARLENFLVFQ